MIESVWIVLAFAVAFTALAEMRPRPITRFVAAAFLGLLCLSLKETPILLYVFVILVVYEVAMAIYSVSKVK